MTFCPGCCGSHGRPSDCAIFKGTDKLLVCCPGFRVSPGWSLDCELCCTVYSRTSGRPSDCLVSYPAQSKTPGMSSDCCVFRGLNKVVICPSRLEGVWNSGDGGLGVMGPESTMVLGVTSCFSCFRGSLTYCSACSRTHGRLSDCHVFRRSAKLVRAFFYFFTLFWRSGSQEFNGSMHF